MNTKLSHLFGLSRSYQQHGQYHHNQQVNRFSLHTWKFLLDKLKQELPSRTERLQYFKTLQNGIKVLGTFLGKECSPIVAQRAVRGYRILQLHSRLWSYSSSNPVSKRALFSFMVLSLCQAKDKRAVLQEINNVELMTHNKDLDYIRELTAATVVCADCKDRIPIDKKLPGVSYCTCPDSPQAVFSKTVDGHAWEPFVETLDLLIWRKPHPDYPGLYEYKVYGYYDDISAHDFLEAQLDIEYRKEWDDTALQLDVVEKDTESKTEIIYWEMKWPRMFTNRDYLFLRRHEVYKEKNDIVIMSKAVTHPDVPEKKGAHRVEEYRSVMHIRAKKGLSQPGVEFGLTYFDNPGVSLPQWLTTWAAKTGIPEFLNKQRNAARARRCAREAANKPLIPVSSPQPNYSNTGKKYSTPKQTSPAAVPIVFHSNNYKQQKEETRTSSLTRTNLSLNNNTNKDIANCSDSQTSDNSNNNVNITSNMTNPVPSSVNQQQQQQEGKNELLSQFFKEQILEVHS